MFEIKEKVVFLMKMTHSVAGPISEAHSRQAHAPNPASRPVSPAAPRPAGPTRPAAQIRPIRPRPAPDPEPVTQLPPGPAQQIRLAHLITRPASRSPAGIQLQPKPNSSTNTREKMEKYQFL